MVPRLPLNPMAEEWWWQLDARCRGEDPTIFFPPDHLRGRARERRVLAAKEICAGCPVAARCRDHALTFQERFGIWGGLSANDRFELLRSASDRDGQPGSPLHR